MVLFSSKFYGPLSTFSYVLGALSAGYVVHSVCVNVCVCVGMSPVVVFVVVVAKSCRMFWRVLSSAKFEALN